jgi:putative endonuclease
LQKYYVGHTEDIERRLNEHNMGRGNFTSKGVPWEMIKIIECSSKSEAIILENRIKKRGIKRYLQDIQIL